MKKIFTKLMLLAVAAAALVSCENKIDESTPVVELTQTVTLTAEKPVEVRTEMIEGVPYWSKGDKIGVYTEEKNLEKEYSLTNDAEEATLTTSFTGTTSLSETLFVFYPSKSYGTNLEKGAKTEIAAIQHPTATSFDGASDIMFAKPVTLDAEGKQLSDLEFARLGAIVKIVLKDNTSSLAGQHVSALTMTAANNLTGRVYLDVVNQELGELYYGQLKTVTAEYSEATQYEVNGTNATYVIVYPQTLKSGSTLSFQASTEGYAISKSIVLGQDIVLESGKVTTLNVSLAAANVVKEETGLDLPFEDDFARFALDANETAINNLGENYSSIEKIYKSKEVDGAIKFGTSSAAGHITTVPLNLSQPFTVLLAAKNYGTDATTVKVTVGGVSKTVTLTGSVAYYAVEFDAASKKESVTVASNADSKQRFHLDDLQVVAGHDVVLPTLPPVLTVSTSTISVSHEAATETFTYSVANPVDGVNVAISDNADWITTSVSGTTVTVNVAENTAEEAREGVITVTYGDLTKTVTVNQNAKPAEGGETASGWIRVTSLADITSGTYVIVANAVNTDYYCPNSTFYSSTHPKAVTIAEKGVSVSGDQLVGTIIDDMKWTFTGTATNMVITKYNGTAQLYNTATNNGVWVATPSTASYWKFTVQGSNFLATYNSTSRCLGLYNTQDWRSYQNTALNNYKNTNGEIRLYKLVGEEGGNGGSTPEPATPVLSINPTTLSFDAAGGNKTVACTIENEVSGVNVTATESVDWLTTSVSGKTVTITATENTATTTRTATVTIAYTGAESKTVTVNQAAAEVVEPEQPGGGETESKTYTENFTTWTYNNTSNTATGSCAGNACTWSYVGASKQYWSNVSSGSSLSNAITLLKPGAADGTYVLSEVLDGGIKSLTVTAISNNTSTGVNVYVIDVATGTTHKLGTVNTTTKKKDFKGTWDLSSKGITGKYQIKIANKSTAAYCCIGGVVWSN